MSSAYKSFTKSYFQDMSSLNTSILAVVTTGMNTYVKDDVRLIFVKKILENFAGACDAGYKVEVVLVAYDDTSLAVREKIASMFRSCKRDRAALHYSIQLFTFRNLPKTAFGTAGDLAIRHRELFLERKKDFDFFLVQEDDVSYDSTAIRYFADNYLKLRHISPKIYPNFFDFEDLHGNKYANYRMRGGYIFKLQTESFFNSYIGTCGRGYMIPREYLLLIANDSSWIDPQNTVGEFNPTVASTMVLESGVRLVHPLIEWENGGIHHMSNRYLGAELGIAQQGGIDSQDPVFTSPRFDELRYIFSSCLNRDASIPPGMKVEGACYACLESAGAVFMSSEILNPFSSDREIVVKYECSKFDEKKLRG